MKRTYILFSIVLAVALLLAVSEVRAQYPTTPLTAPRECKLPAGAVTPTLTIVAGPCTNDTGEVCTNGKDVEFPKLVNCPSEYSIDPILNHCPTNSTYPTGIPGQFLMWEYKFTYTGINPSHSLLTVASDVEITSTQPSAYISDPGVGDSTTKLGANVWEVRTLRFNENITTYWARYWTKPGLMPRVATAGGLGSKFQGYCVLAGAGTRVTEPLQALTTDVLTDAGGCIVRRTVDSRGYTTAMELLPGSPPTCQIFVKGPPVIDGTEATFITPEAQMTFGTTTLYCYPYKDTFGNLKTICVNR